MAIFFCALSWTIGGLVLLFFFILAVRSNLLRDEIDNPAALVANAAAVHVKYLSMAYDQIPRPYSLARAQLGIWMVAAALVYLQHILCAHCLFTVAGSSTTLALLGISAGTAGLANMIDKRDQRQRTIVPRHQNGPSRGFFHDILSDGAGLSIHRFQYFLWTLVAIVIYLYKASSRDCALPEPDGTLLLLTGISSATYLGLKINENK